MPLHPTRRGFIAGSLLLPLTQTAAKADSELSSPPPNNEAAALLRRRDELLEQQRQLDERWKIANAQLPDWCKPGHKYRDIKGKEFGGRVGWPPLSEPIPIEGVGFLVRPSPRDLRNLLSREAREIEHSRTLHNYRNNIRNLRGQLAARRQIVREVGLPRSVDWAPIDQEIEVIEALITA
ncbi:MAG: hypothetical protein EKK42_15090 [Pseudonocardiaceae bacterium]|jgi:hypothetical protein|nr:MAG: hypothetical protein EKK42_15090 [Pseudonocardiaceae bacterium]